MNTAFTNWIAIHKHAGAMLMAPAILGLGILAFSYFSWSKQVIEEASLLDVVMEIKVELERTHMYLHEMERDLILLRDFNGNTQYSTELNEKVLTNIEKISESINNLNVYSNQTIEGTSKMGHVHLSQIEIKPSVDEILLKDLNTLQISIKELSDYILPKLTAKEYQSFIYDSENDVIFEQALESAQASDDRVHTIIKDKLDMQRRIFLLFVLAIGALTTFVYYKWTKLSKEHTEHLTNLYFSSQTTEQSQDMVIVTDLHGVIDYVNSVFITLTGYKQEDVMGQHLTHIFTDEGAWEKDALQHIPNKEEWRDGAEIRAKNGHVIKTKTRGYPILDQSNKPAFCVIRLKKN